MKSWDSVISLSYECERSFSHDLGIAGWQDYGILWFQDVVIIGLCHTQEMRKNKNAESLLVLIPGFYNLTISPSHHLTIFLSYNPRLFGFDDASAD